MNPTLERIWRDRRKELEAADITVDGKGFILTKYRVIRIPYDAPSGLVERTIRLCLEKSEDDRREAQQRKQTNLF